MFALPADHRVTTPLPKFAVLPNVRLLPPEIPLPLKGTCKVLALVSSVHPIDREAAALPAVVHAAVRAQTQRSGGNCCRLSNERYGSVNRSQPSSHCCLAVVRRCRTAHDQVS